MSHFTHHTLGRAGFFASALLAAVAVPAAANPWPRLKDGNGCDDYLPTLDLDAPWHHADAGQDNNQGCAPKHNLSMAETRNLASRFAAALLTSDSVRGNYYKLIRTWKKGKGKYGQQYIAILQPFATSGKQLALDDIANVHLTTFLILRRAVLALTAHDIDPDAFDAVTVRSYHFGPNDGSMVSYRASDLVDPYQP
jgi:hypothetical protein